MDPEQWRRVAAVYHSALDRDPAQRAAYLEHACQDAPELRREVESLLARAGDDSFLERPAWQSADSKDDESEVAESIGATARRHPFFWLVGIALAGLVALFGYAAWRMPQDVEDFGWREAQRGAVVLVFRVNPGGPAAGLLQPGDRLLSLNGDPYVARVGSSLHRLSLGIGDRYRIEVERSGATEEFVLGVGRARPSLRGRLSYIFIGFVWCAVGLWIGFARPQDGLARLAFGAASVTGVVFVTVGNLPGIYAPAPLHVVLGYHFFYWFPAGAPRGKIWRPLLWLLYLAAAAIAVLRIWKVSVLHAAGPGAATAVVASSLHSLWEPLISIAGGIAMLAAIAVAVRKYRALVDADQRRRFHWVAFGGAVGLAPATLYGVLNLLNPGSPGAPEWLISQESWQLFSLGVNAFSVAVPLCIAYAVVKERVFDIRVAIRRGIQYLLAKRALQVLLAFPSAALFYNLVADRHRTIAELVTEISGYLYWILTLGLSLIFRSRLTRWLDRRFFREEYDSEQIVLRLVDDLAGFDSAPEMTGFVVGQIERALHPTSMHWCWREGGKLRFASSSDPALEGAPCPVGEHLLHHLERLGTVADIPLPADTGIAGMESRRLAKRGVRMVVPLVGVERLEGILMLGEKRSEEPYTPGDRRLLHAVARQAAIVRDNLRLKGQVIGEQRVRRDVLARLDRGLVDVMQECPRCGACFDSQAQVCDRDGSPLSLTLPVARTIDGKYRLERLIGKGGMGAVYEALDLRLRRQVAVKIMLGGHFGQEAALRRFRREAQAVARLDHPNIVRLFDFGDIEGGGAYLVMEYVRGATLREEMNRIGVFAPAETADWFEQILAGLAAAHERGVVHRDLKPENILGDRRASVPPVVKILDFGLAKNLPLAAGAAVSQSLTESGAVLGTVAYMAPEQFSGEDVDQRADLYSAGVVLVEMLTGHRPFEHGARLRADYRLPPGIADRAALDAVLQRCLATAPEERFSSARELCGALIPALRQARR